ncbi:hypothetical protein K3495_g122 [Podosphaera aphanis]|nr:hypothetical protein K3495_g122 [Podosphaera aphanis]
MSLSSELRVVCLQLSSTPTTELPHLVPYLSQYLLRCQNSLSVVTPKAQGSSASVLVHKLKTQLTTKLNGRVSEGRFAAVVLIKAALEAGGWEVLKISEPWVRAMITIIARSDPTVTKELCIVTLTKFYLLAHQHQSLVREVSTPTLPLYINVCLNILSSKPGSKARHIPQSLRENIFRSFSQLLPYHSSIFRPFTSQIRNCIHDFLAPSTEIPFFTTSLKQSARHLSISLLQTAPKGLGGNEWSKSLEELIKNIHISADQAFQAIDENWASTSTYNGGPTDPSIKQLIEEEKPDDSSVIGLECRLYRLIGLIEFLSEYFHSETPGPVTVPLGIIFDIARRFMSLEVPQAAELSANRRENRALNSGAGIEELDTLRSRIPQIYIAVIQLLCAISDRLQEKFIPLASECFDCLVWVFPNGQHIPEFRQASFEIISRILLRFGKGLCKSQLRKLSTIIRSCCNELYCDENSTDINQNQTILELDRVSSSASNESASATFVQSNPKGHGLSTAASKLLPLFVSHISQQHLHLSIRVTIERAAIFSKNKDTMLACILNPFTGHSNMAMCSILPLLSRQFSPDDVVETFLRPRMPLLPLVTPKLSDDNHERNSEEEICDENKAYIPCETLNSGKSASPFLPESSRTSTQYTYSQMVHENGSNFEIRENIISDKTIVPKPSIDDLTMGNSQTITTNTTQVDVHMSLGEVSDDEESVHLTMQMDTDSDTPEE